MRQVIDGQDGDVARAAINDNFSDLDRFFGRISGRLYPVFEGSVATGTAVPAVDTLYVMPFRLDEAITLSSMAIRIATGGAGSSVKMALWAHDKTTVRPTGTPIAGAASNTPVSTVTSSVSASMSASATLPPGYYWAGFVFTGTLPTPVTANDSSVMARMLGRAALSSNAGVSGLSTAFTFTNDITALNLTGATWADASGGVPILNIGA